MINEASEQHQSVLLDEAIRQLAIRTDGFYIDATFGRGGHSRTILQQLGPKGRLLALDKDGAAIAHAHATITDERFAIEQVAFDQLQSVVTRAGYAGNVSGILFDLGVSSPQLDEPARGFSFMREGPLDMRMDERSELTAAAWINHASLDDMIDVFRTYGEERYARRVANAIVSERAIAPMTTTTQLAAIIKQAIPKWEKGQHPATRCFQAIRIFINQELVQLPAALQQAVDMLAVGGRLVVISFHSLEDRIVKRFLRDQARGQQFPRGVPVRANEINPVLQVIGRAVRPLPQEVERNPRSRSAILRVAEKRI